MSDLNTDSVGFKIVGYSIVGIGLVVLIGLIVVLGYMISGLVLSILWGWFMVPLFEVPEISILEAIGITLVVHLFMRRLATKTDIDAESEISTTKIGKALARSFIVPLITLLTGWIVLQFM